jgi:hypothetical protein
VRPPSQNILLQLSLTVRQTEVTPVFRGTVSGRLWGFFFGVTFHRSAFFCDAPEQLSTLRVEFVPV